MGIGSTLRRLGRFIEECERVETVAGVALAEEIDQGTVDDCSATVDLTLSHGVAGESTELCATSVNADGTVRFGFETDDAVVPSVEGVEAEPTGAAVDADGLVELTLSVTVPTEARSPSVGGSLSDGETAVDPVGDGNGDATGDVVAGGTETDRDLPPFKNPELLEEVYESCDTFAEMADTLEMDVTAETVRRYMIDFEIHEPNTYDTGTGAEEVETDDPASAEEVEVDDPASAEEIEATPPVLSDGIGLPDDITVETLIETVERSNTIYEVKRDLGVAREDALEMLRECNLLDLVMCRLATEAERDITRDDVIERLRAASEGG